MFSIQNGDIFSADAKMLLGELNSVLSAITRDSGAASFREEDALETRGAFLIGYLDGEAISCGAIREFSPSTAEMKRIYARKNSVGAARSIIAALEKQARRNGFEEIRLETRTINEHAVRFYSDCGYAPCKNYGKYIGRKDAVCFSKKL